MFDLSPYMNLIWAGIGISSILIGLKVVFNSPYMKERAKGTTIEKKAKLKGDSMFDKLDDYIQNGEKHIAKIEQEKEELRKKGVTEDQMGHLNFEENALKTLQHPVVQIIYEPATQIVKKFARNWGLNL